MDATTVAPNTLGAAAGGRLRGRAAPKPLQKRTSPEAARSAASLWHGGRASRWGHRVWPRFRTPGFLPYCLQTAFAQGAVFSPRFASGLPRPFGSLGLPIPTAPFPGGPDPVPSHHADGVGREEISTRFPSGLLGPFSFAFRLVKSPEQVLGAEALRMPLKKQMIFLFFCFSPKRREDLTAAGGGSEGCSI